MFYIFFILIEIFENLTIFSISVHLFIALNFPDNLDFQVYGFVSHKKSLSLNIKQYDPPKKQTNKQKTNKLKEVKTYIFRRNWIFRHTFGISNPDCQSCGIIMFLCKCFIVISDILVGTFSDVLFLMLAVTLPELLEKPRRNQDLVTEKST